MNQPRLRIVAGPNGSGKSTLLKDLSKVVRLGHYLNPDAIEQELRNTGWLDFSPWGLQVRQQDLRRFIRQHPLGERLRSDAISVAANRLHIIRAMAGGYLAAVLCDFMRRRWLRHNVTFTFETVMSSPDKIELLRQAAKRGYHSYLYFVCTDSPLLNMERVAARVRDGGHAVPPDKIVVRYERSLALLQQAIAHTWRAYIFDNSLSERPQQLIAEYHQARLVKCVPEPPAWFARAAPAD